MIENSAGKDSAALVVFGQTDKNARHAGWFTTAESANAKKSAAVRSLAVIEPIPDEVQRLLPKIARGRFVMGQISLSKADPSIYEKLLECLAASKQPEGAQANSGEAGSEEAPVTEVPQSVALPEAAASGASPTSADLWRRIKVGDPVLARYEGWWQARVLAVYGDTVRVGWQGGDDQDYDEVSRSDIALLFPGN